MKILLFIIPLILLPLTNQQVMNSIRKMEVKTALAGVLAYEELTSLIYQTNLFNEFKKEILNKLDSEREEIIKDNIDWKNKIIYTNYFKRIYHNDKWHHSFALYNIVTFVDKREEKRICKKVLRMTRCYTSFEPVDLNQNDVNLLRDRAINSIYYRTGIKFSNSADESHKEKFYLEFPNFRK